MTFVHASTCTSVCDDLYHMRESDVCAFIYNSSLEGAMKLKFAPFCSSRDALSDGILFLPKSVFGKKPWTITHGFVFQSPEKVLRKAYHLNGYEKRNLMALVSAA